MTADLDEHDARAQMRALLERFPRSEWRREHSSEAVFWLEIHDGFRHGCATLGELGDDYRRGRLAAAGLAARAAPMLRGFIAHLSGHHRIEDDHYFPTFRSAEPRLARAFDALAADHETLQHDIDTTLAALDALTAAVRHETSGAAAAQAAAARYVRDSASLFDRLCRHFGDEENLVVPLLLARGT